MNKTHLSYCEFHLGDNLLHLHFLRAMAERYTDHRFVHALHGCHRKQLKRVVEDLPNIALLDETAFACMKGETPAVQITGELIGPMSNLTLGPGRNVWKNAGGFWERHELRNDVCGFYLRWYRHLAEEMGLETPIPSLNQMPFAYPALFQAIAVQEAFATPRFVRSPSEAEPVRDVAVGFDILFVNSQPGSGQFLDYNDPDCMTPMLIALLQAGHRVLCTAKPGGSSASNLAVPEEFNGHWACTADRDMDITDIGAAAVHIPWHVMISTGPHWTTFNQWSMSRNRLVMIGVAERLNYPVHGWMGYADSRAHAWGELQKLGLL